MREHQIVITLKPEQFARVQQLSKAAGAKSMGIFVRKALLEALEMNAPSPEKSPPVEALATSEAVVSDLKKMHAELRDLILESLAIHINESFSAEPEEVVFQVESEESPPEPVVEEEPIVSSIKVKDPLDELLDERLKTRLEKYLEETRKVKPKVPTTRRPEPEKPISPVPTPSAESTDVQKPVPPASPAPESRPAGPRTVPPGQPSEGQKSSYSQKIPPLSGNPPPKKPKY